MAKQGPITRDEMMSIWAASVDKSYRKPLQDAGDGKGLEVYGQSAEQLARVSTAIDRTTQAMYILPHSGQTDEPASGARKATVTLSIRRQLLAEQPLILGKGHFIVSEETTDAGENGPVLVQPGRRYLLRDDLVFLPGQMGPLDVIAEAEFEGTSFNNPLPDTIGRPVQAGTGFTRARATVIAPDFTNLNADGLIRSINEADTFVPDHVGQYVRFISGLNLGKVVRIASFAEPPDPSIQAGSTVSFDVIHAVDATVFAGSFQIGEQLSINGGAGFGTLLGKLEGGVTKLVFRFRTGTNAVVGNVITGVSSAATLTVRVMLSNPSYVSEAPVGSVGGAEWEVLDWEEHFGIEITNAASPNGGRFAMLDELGAERGLSRSPSENDAAYRYRVATLADVVSPKAIMRSISKSFGNYSWTFREVGLERLLGFFYDGTTEPPEAAPGREPCDAYDTDVYLYTGARTGTWKQAFIGGDGIMCKHHVLSWEGASTLQIKRETQGQICCDNANMLRSQAAGT
mgnify:CR=1 FL=1